MTQEKSPFKAGSCSGGSFEWEMSFLRNDQVVSHGRLAAHKSGCS